MILKLWERNGSSSDGTNGEKREGGAKYRLTVTNMGSVVCVCVCTVVVKGCLAYQGDGEARVL